MALHWEWDNVIGATIDEGGRVVTLYGGNAYAIAIDRWYEDGEMWWNMEWFAVSRDHMKNLLGMNKKESFTENIFKGSGITGIYLLREWRNAAHMVGDILKSGWDVNIHLVGANLLNEITEVKP